MSNKEKQNLEDFSLPQLNILLKHLRLGLDHLKLLLNPQQFEELFKMANLSQEQQFLISATKSEKLGNMSLIINTILTSTFGAWMGLSGCVGCGLGSFRMLFIISFIAFFVSGLIGYMSLKMTHKQAQDALKRQLVYNLQLKVLKIINQKLNEKNDSVIFYLNTAVFILQNVPQNQPNEIIPFSSMQESYQWLERLDGTLRYRLSEIQLGSDSLYEKQIKQAFYLIRKTFAKHVQFLETLSNAHERKEKAKKMMPLLPALKVLTNPTYGIPKYQNTAPASWIHNNFLQLVLGLIPTIWGGFASMFVFVGGIPNIARELNFLELANFLTQPFARTVEISMAAMVTCYFAFAFFYSSRKGWYRQKLLEKIEKEIANEDTLYLQNSHKLTMLYKVKAQTQRLISVVNVLKKVEGELTLN